MHPFAYTFIFCMHLGTNYIRCRAVDIAMSACDIVRSVCVAVGFVFVFVLAGRRIKMAKCQLITRGGGSNVSLLTKG